MPTQATQLITKVYIQIMHTAELKSKMMQLWKNTFHDSDAYISLVFDTYFNPDLIAYNEENGNWFLLCWECHMSSETGK